MCQHRAMAHLTTPPSAAAPLVVLVHGAWHGAWCWAALQAELDSRGIASLAVDLPGHGASTRPLADLYGDAQHVADVVAQLDRPVVLVGHSYGGAVITEAASNTAGIHHLVYLAAFALAQNESIMALLGQLPPVEVALSAAIVQGADGVSSIDASKAAAAFYGSCPPAMIPAAIARLSPQPMITFGQPVTGDPRASTPSTYVCCTRDQSVAIAHQQVLAERCTHSVTLDTDHSPFASMPVETADVIVGVLAGAAS
jgi:pimeloyl-ACP methyl ester carboxylesterase